MMPDPDPRLPEWLREDEGAPRVRRARRPLRAPHPRVIGAWLLAVVGACVATLLVAGTVMLVIALFRGPWPA